MQYLQDKLVRKGRVVDKYLRRLAVIFLKHREVLLEPRPTGKAVLSPRVLPGVKPTRVGLTRRVPAEAIQGLNEEVREIFDMAGFSPLFEITPSLDEARSCMVQCG